MNIAQKIKKLFDPVELTSGSIYKSLIAFLIPIVLSMLFQQLYTLTDALIVGQTLSEEEVAGVNSSSPLVFIVLQFGMGCTAGFSVVISEKIGMKDISGVKKSFFVQIVLSVAISAILTLIGILMIPTMLSWLGITPSIVDLSMQKEYEAAYTYLLFIYIGILFQLLYNLIVSVLRALGDSFTPFLFLVGSTILNVGLDLLFILAFHWGVAGSAVATVISQGIAAIGAIIYGCKKYDCLKIKKEDFKAPLSLYWKHLYNGLPMGFQFSVLEIGIIVMQAAVIAFDFTPAGTMVAGLPAQMGYGTACKIFGLLMTFLNGLGTAVLSYVSQNYGAGKYKRVREGIKASMMIGIVLWVFITIVGLLLTINGSYEYLFLSENKVTSESIRYGNTYLFVSVPLMIILMVLFVERNALQGLQKPLWPFLSGVGELVARTLVCLYLPALVNGGPINSSASNWAFVAVSAADPAAWVLNVLVSLPCLIISIKQISKLDDAPSKAISKEGQ